MDVKHEIREKSKGLYEVVITFTGPKECVDKAVEELSARSEEILGRKPDMVIMDEEAFSKWAKPDVEN